MMCDWCSGFIDSDYDCEGAYSKRAVEFMCSRCCEEYEVDGSDENALDQFIASEAAAEEAL